MADERSLFMEVKILCLLSGYDNARDKTEDWDEIEKKPCLDH